MNESTLEPTQSKPLSSMSVLGMEGDFRLEWDENNADQVSIARETFNKMKKEKKYAAFKLTASGERGEQLNSFDPSAERILMVPPVVGG